MQERTRRRRPRARTGPGRLTRGRVALYRRLRVALGATAAVLRRTGRRIARTVRARLRPWSPVVLVDARRARARRLRRVLRHAARAQFRALGVPPPPHLLVVVQRTVSDGRPLAALLQVYEDAGGRQRHVLFIALAVDGEPVGDGAIVATLRQQLLHLAGGELGELVHAHAQPARVPDALGEAAASDAIPAGAVVADDEPPPLDDEWLMRNGAVPVAAGR
mgnify:CR=1 FL=1